MIITAAVASAMDKPCLTRRAIALLMASSGLKGKKFRVQIIGRKLSK